MIGKVRVRCPNPRCKKGRIYDAVGFVGFDEPCPTCNGLGYVMVDKSVPDQIIRHEHHYYRH